MKTTDPKGYFGTSKLVMQDLGTQQHTSGQQVCHSSCTRGLRRSQELPIAERTFYTNMIPWCGSDFGSQALSKRDRNLGYGRLDGAAA
jgi:hypothetical protein